MKNGLYAHVEVRPRAEYTSNYALPPNDSVTPFLMVTVRNRLSMDYVRPKWMVRSEFQEIHYWDDNSKVSKVGSINFYQLYLESRFKGINVRIGRQGVLLDNGRIFSDAPWAQQSRAHEGVRLMKATKNWHTDLFLLFTRNYSNRFDPVFSPVGGHKYKYLFVYQFSYHPGKPFSFNAISAVDAFRNADNGKIYNRFTLGGRVEMKHHIWYYTLNSFIQFGQNPQFKKLFAYYFQPEVRVAYQKFTFRLGAEMLSGSRPGLASSSSGDFDVLYGVAWKFLGNMNIFTRFPNDVAGKGLVNPYFFTIFSLHKNLSFRADMHLFFTQYSPGNGIAPKPSRYLGWESDLSFRWLPVRNLELNYGFSFLKSASSMQYLPKIVDFNKTAVWSYLMASYTFDLYKPKQ